MQATRVIAVRHGETDWNAAGRIQGHTDIGLNAQGRWQAARLADALAGQPLDAVYSSDLARAVDTAAAVAAQAGLPLEIDSALRERSFGEFEGSTFTEIEQRWPAEAVRWRRRDPDFAPPGGEPLDVFHARCVDTARQLASRHAGHQIVVVAHGGVLDCLYRAASRTALSAPRTWRVGNAAINRLLHTPEGFALVGWSDSMHLEGGPSGALHTDGLPALARQS